MKRILQITGSMNRGGAETMIMNLYRKINRVKFQFDFVVFGDKGDFDEEIFTLGGKIYYLKTNSTIKRMYLLWKLLRENKEYQIIHCHTNFSNAFHIISAMLSGVKMRVAHSHNTSDFSRNIVVSYFYQPISKFIINRFSTHFMACGEAASKFLFYKNKKVIVLPNSVDVNLLADIGISNKNYINRLYENINDHIKIIQVGRHVPEKNYIHSIKIAQELKKRNIKFKFFIVGRGELDYNLKKIVKNLGLEKDIIFLGVRGDVPHLMAGSDIMLMPSLYEGFPVVLVEAQAIGLKCLISTSISKEVDLNVGLVKFLDLKENIGKWTDELISSIIVQEEDIDLRVHKIKEEGFDIGSNAVFLEKFYLN